MSFASGPSMLPAEVRDQVAVDLQDHRGTGLSVLELAPHHLAMTEILDRAEADVRCLLGVPDEYAVLFLHGGASAQFAMVPHNLSDPADPVAYLDTGLWSRKAIDEARTRARVTVVADAAREGYRRIPWPDAAPAGCRYVHYTQCDSVRGLAFPAPPDPGGAPLVADATACLFAVPTDIAAHGLVYASGQKNLGATGLCLVVVREDLLTSPRRDVPAAFNYALQARCRSRFTTPPLLAWYIAGLMLGWIRSRGGVPTVAAAVRRRADILHAAIDGSGFYCSRVEPTWRSTTTIPFTLRDTRLPGTFLAEAAAAGLTGLAGHSSVGGLRACLFVGTPDIAVDALASFLADFERRFG
jgi:phosphoserine aminotransferase